MTSKRRVILMRTLIVAAIIIVSGLVLFIFLTGQLVGFYDPIKEYSYSVPIEQLRKETITEINKSSYMEYEVPDTVALPKKRFLNYLTIKIVDVDQYYQYDIKFEDDDKFWKPGQSSKLCVLSAFDNHRWTGGYKIDDKDVKRLIDTLEIRLINRLFPD
jgi:hypothetical protein